MTRFAPRDNDGSEASDAGSQDPAYEPIVGRMDSHLRATLIEVLGSRDDVVAAYVFGSVARGQARPDSDVDVAALFTSAPPFDAWGPSIRDSG